MSKKVVIVGAGLAGLSTAIRLIEAGEQVTVFEKAERAGGRIKTDEEGGFLLDQGFQVLLTAYPEAQAWFDYEALDLKPFLPGAMILSRDGRRKRIGDPLRAPSLLIPTLFSGVGSFREQWKLLGLRKRLIHTSVAAVFQQTECSTEEALSDYGLDQSLKAQFLRPFFAGIFLEPNLSTSRRMFDFVFKMMAEGQVVIPSAGMEALPRQLANRLPKNTIQYKREVIQIEGNRLRLADGEEMEARHIVLATEESTTARLLGRQQPEYRRVYNLYFYSDRPAYSQRLVALNPDPEGLVNNLCIMSNVAPDYAPEGKHLISITVLEQQIKNTESPLALQVKQELKKWFGASVDQWEHLRTYLIPYALPEQTHVQHQVDLKRQNPLPGLTLAGDFLLNGSINAALKSGESAAAQVLERIKASD